MTLVSPELAIACSVQSRKFVADLEVFRKNRTFRGEATILDIRDLKYDAHDVLQS